MTAREMHPHKGQEAQMFEYVRDREVEQKRTSTTGIVLLALLALALIVTVVVAYV